MSANENQSLAPAKAALQMGSRGIALSTLEEVYRFAELVSRTNFAPKDFRTPESICIALAYGMELGLSPMQSLQGVAIINNKPALYGDALIGVVMASGLCENIREWFDGDGDAHTAHCEVKRRGMESPVLRSFSITDAKKAGLWGRQGPWSQYSDRMQQMRARGFALRDAFPDVLRGAISTEEANDYPVERNVTPLRPVDEHPPVVSRKNAATTEQLLLISTMCGKSGIDAAEYVMAETGETQDELQVGAAQAIIGKLKAKELENAEMADALEAARALDAEEMPFDREPPPADPDKEAEADQRRESEGRALAAMGNVEHDEKRKRYVVTSGGKEKTKYYVTKPNGKLSCTCPDHKFNGDENRRCKHAWAVVHFVAGTMDLVAGEIISEHEAADLLSAFNSRGINANDWLMAHGVASGLCRDATIDVMNAAYAEIFS